MIGASFLILFSLLAIHSSFFSVLWNIASTSQLWSYGTAAFYEMNDTGGWLAAQDLNNYYFQVLTRVVS